jgi:hypothetical protein
MQTFLPFPQFDRCASVLDNKRLGKQRVETLQIFNALLGKSKGWTNHPAVRMWRGYESALFQYQVATVREWLGRGFNDTCLQKTAHVFGVTAANLDEKLSGPMPPWLGRFDLHQSHRSNLVRKDFTHYGQFGWPEDGTHPYVWPVA